MTLGKRAASHHAHCAESGERRAEAEAEAEGDLVRFGGLATSWLRLMS
ncbi:methionyl-tRNA synthetase [Burkholderia thailandensis]|nr:methionyl-tRNA synthetase [Burkholderia thailandensis]TGB31661.1 methionyl-tRNA synthetase [Burkholderia thailandensis]